MMDYETFEGRVILYGGCGVVTCPMSDTWSFAGGAWTNITATVSKQYGRPPPLYFGNLVWANGPGAAYLIANTSILYGGCLNRSCSQLSDEAWGFSADPQDYPGCGLPGCWWLQLSDLPAVAGEQMAYDAASQNVVINGGFVTCAIGRCAVGDTLVIYAFSWTDLTSSNSDWLAPPSRYGGSMFYDPASNTVLLFGGLPSSQASPLSDTWILRCAAGSPPSCTWTPGDPPEAPPPLADATDASSSSVAPVIFDGNSTGAVGSTPSELWAWGQDGSVTETVQPDPVVINQPVEFWDRVEGNTSPLIGYWWSFTDHASVYSQERTVTEQFTTPGPETGTALVLDGRWLALTILFHFSVAPGPSPRYTIWPDPSEPGATIWFNATVTLGTGLGPFDYIWYIGGGVGSETGTSVSFTLRAVGTFALNLTVIDSLGNQGSTVGTFTVLPGPSATIHASRSVVDVGESVNFTATILGGVAPVQLTWYPDDGTQQQGAWDLHPYWTTGIFRANVTATDALGGESSNSTFIRVNPLLSTAIDFVSGNGSQAAGSVLSMGSDTFGGTPPYSYAWSFGDGNTSGAAAPQHTYGTAGTYLIHLVVTDAAGAKANASATVQVPASTPTENATAPPALSGAEVGAVLALCALVLATVLVLWIRRRRSGPPG
jgi:PKD repeat protein